MRHPGWIRLGNHAAGRLAVPAAQPFVLRVARHAGQSREGCRPPITCAGALDDRGDPPAGCHRDLAQWQRVPWTMFEAIERGMWPVRPVSSPGNRRDIGCSESALSEYAVEQADRTARERPAARARTTLHLRVVPSGVRKC
jgi:hypothetical protein